MEEEFESNVKYTSEIVYDLETEKYALELNGRTLTFEELAKKMETYEGWNFSFEFHEL